MWIYCGACAGLAGDFTNGGQAETEKQKMLLRERGGISSATNQEENLVSQAQAQVWVVE